MGDRALLIGIGKYPGLSTTMGCGDDAQRWSALLQQEYGFGLSTDIRCPALKDCNKPALLNDLLWLFSDSVNTDRRLLFFSGHGVQLASSQPANEGLLLYPGDLNSQSILTDLELATAIQSGAGFDQQTRTTIVLDCCFAGGFVPDLTDDFAHATAGATIAFTTSGSTKAGDAREKIHPDSSGLGWIPPASSSFTGRIASLKTHHILCFAACAANQSAYDLTFATGGRGGLFTRILIAGLNADPSATYARAQDVLQSEAEGLRRRGIIPNSQQPFAKSTRPDGTQATFLN